MSAVNEALEAVIGLMNATHPFAAVTRGALPVHHGITCEIGALIGKRRNDCSHIDHIVRTLYKRPAILYILEIPEKDLHAIAVLLFPLLLQAAFSPLVKK